VEGFGGDVRTLKDKGVLITGAGRGIGKRLALGFASAGARVGLLARSKAELDLAQLEIEHAGGMSLRIRADVRDFEQVCAAVERMRAHFGGVHVLVAAAAVQGPIGLLAEAHPRAWAETLETNLLGVMHACRAVLPHMIGLRAGKILVLGGDGATGPRPNFSAYAAAKAGVVRMVETLAEEVLDHNIQVNCMIPGGTYTHMTDEILHAGQRAGWKAHQEALEVRVSGGVSPQKQIQLAMFLASERSNHVTGKLIHVNDDWKRLEKTTAHPELYTLRRVQKV
jgi:NAD(P)-dependent dehydrogenase (short-subunit alcohol dehydrogenase family)